MLTNLLYTLTLILIVGLSNQLYAALRATYASQYDTAALLSLLLLSGLSALAVFVALLVRVIRQLSQLYQGWRQQAAATSARSQALRHQGGGLRRPLLPQSEFARRWNQRKTASYDEIRQTSLQRGEQVPLRLRWEQLQPGKPRPLCPHEKHSHFFQVIRHRRR
jgi:hypothetical protein